MNRKKEIEKLKVKGLSLRAIGAKLKPPISGERVRQLLLKKGSVYCEVHKINYRGLCSLCTKDDFNKRVMSKIRKHPIYSDIKRLRVEGRTKYVVQDRIKLIKTLRDDFKLSYPHIGKLLNRNHTTIIHLYNQ